MQAFTELINFLHGSRFIDGQELEVHYLETISNLMFKIVQNLVVERIINARLCHGFPSPSDFEAKRPVLWGPKPPRCLRSKISTKTVQVLEIQDLGQDIEIQDFEDQNHPGPLCRNCQELEVQNRPGPLCRNGQELEVDHLTRLFLD